MTPDELELLRKFQRQLQGQTAVIAAMLAYLRTLGMFDETKFQRLLLAAQEDAALAAALTEEERQAALLQFARGPAQ